MAEKEYLIDDRVIIPDEIKAMSKDELEKSIQKIEAEIKAKKEKPLKI